MNISANVLEQAILFAAEKQTEYYSAKLDTMVFYNDCGVRIELDK